MDGLVKKRMRRFMFLNWTLLSIITAYFMFILILGLRLYRNSNELHRAIRDVEVQYTSQLELNRILSRIIMNEVDDFDGLFAEYDIRTNTYLSTLKDYDQLSKRNGEDETYRIYLDALENSASKLNTVIEQARNLHEDGRSAYRISETVKSLTDETDLLSGLDDAVSAAEELTVLMYDYERTFENKPERLMKRFIVIGLFLIGFGAIILISACVRLRRTN